MNELDSLVSLMKESKNTVVITGAGISVASGIKPFRGKDGVYSTDFKGKPAEYWTSATALRTKPKQFYEFLKERLLGEEYEPNSAHYVLRELQDRGLVGTIITQNIDGLHRKAGSTDIIELHGNLDKFKCMKCGKEYTKDEVYRIVENNPLNFGVPVCEDCGKFIRPHIVLFEECCNRDDFNTAQNLCADADLIIIIGSSLVVSTVKTLINWNIYNLAIVTNGYTPYDNVAKLKIDGDIQYTLDYIIKHI